MSGFTACGKCGGTSFKATAIEPIGCAFKLIAVECAGCNTPFGITDFYNAGALLLQQEQMLKQQETQIGALDLRLREMEDVLQQIAHGLNQHV